MRALHRGHCLEKVTVPLRHTPGARSASNAAQGRTGERHEVRQKVIDRNRQKEKIIPVM